MYLQIYNIITARLTALGMAHIGAAFGPAQPLPSVCPYLADDKEIVDNQSKLRELSWCLEVTVGHDQAGSAQSDMLGMLDTIRDGFVGWKLDGTVGVRGSFRIGSVKAAGYTEHGSLVYRMFVLLRVSPRSFSAP